MSTAAIFSSSTTFSTAASPLTPSAANWRRPIHSACVFVFWSKNKSRASRRSKPTTSASRSETNSSSATDSITWNAIAISRASAYCGKTRSSRLPEPNESQTAMRLRVQFFSQLKEIVGAGEVVLDLPTGATVADLLAQLYREHPLLEKWERNLLVAAGGEFVG